MAKRDIPEINAGSMADIAFLLLIFFLVTTTMDKDTAYLRKIPKLIENPPKPPDIQERDILAIQANRQDKLMVRGDMLDPDDISDKILEFYRTNENAPGVYVDNKFPLYSMADLSYYLAQFDGVEKELSALNAQGATEMAAIKENVLNELQKKIDVIKLYNKYKPGGIPEISYQANLRIETQQLTSYELFTKIHSEIEEALYELKNEKSKELFGVSYDVIAQKSATDLEDRESRERMDLLEVLYPARIIEVKPR